MDQPPFRVRRITEDDAGRLRNLRLRSLQDAPEAFGQSAEEAAGRTDEEWLQQARTSSQGERRAWFLAESGDLGEDMGLVNGRRRPPDSLMVFSMWVEPARRRRGVGRALIDAIDAWAYDAGARHTVLWVFAGNEPAIRFYERIGFNVELDGPDAEIGRGYGALAMSRPTRPNAGSS